MPWDLSRKDVVRELIDTDLRHETPESRERQPLFQLFVGERGFAIGGGFCQRGGQRRTRLPPSETGAERPPSRFSA